jgi:hypothetical protein
VEHYVTLFDTFFLPQGLALHASMERHLKSYRLWILCMDDAVHAALTTLNLPNVNLLKLSELETPELKRVKGGRTTGEYCWTLTPFTPRLVFEADPNVTRVTYLDADMWFRKDPTPIFDEFEASGKDVLITEHHYAAEFDQSERSGRFCVQFMTFARAGGEVVRKWWEERCIEWCYSRVEDGKFGDQKYLDDWPERFAQSVHVLQNREWLLAPWNATRFPYSGAIAWHFHGLRVLMRRNVFAGALCGHYPLPFAVRDHVYRLYLEDVAAACAQAGGAGVLLHAQAVRSVFYRFKTMAFIAYYKLLWLWSAGHIRHS